MKKKSVQQNHVMWVQRGENLIGERTDKLIGEIDIDGNRLVSIKT